MKHDVNPVGGECNVASPPTWEAWIETISRAPLSLILRCRLPRGRRGLKRGTRAIRAHDLKSPPTWEAWIETNKSNEWIQNGEVASHVGGVD